MKLLGWGREEGCFFGFIPKCFRLFFTVAIGNVPLSLEPRNTIEQLGFRAFNIYPSTKLKLAATVILVGPASFQDHLHEWIGFLHRPIQGYVLNEVGPFLDGLIPVLGEVLIILSPPLEIAGCSPSGMGGEGKGVADRQLIEKYLSSFMRPDKTRHNRLRFH